jgi:hypothetical protein
MKRREGTVSEKRFSLFNIGPSKSRATVSMECDAAEKALNTPE